MTLKIALTLMALLTVELGAFPASAEQTLLLKTQKDRESYAMGVELARNWKRQLIDIDPDIVLRGIKDALAGDKLLLSDDELKTTLNLFASRQRMKKAEARVSAGLDNKKKGEAFLAENKSKDGVVALSDGLQYRILKAGDGRKPSEADTVVCNYRGTLIDGTEFDSSHRQGQPATLKVSGVIPGWREALMLMPAGSRWQLFIPPQLAYGQQGSGRIGPNETLLFEVELVDVK
jgi:FKBP-type peptidyl-prolyl cis-trans isomerase